MNWSRELKLDLGVSMGMITGMGMGGSVNDGRMTTDGVV